MANKKISELPYINVSKISGNTLVPLVTYFSATTGDTVHTYVTDFQTYLISGLTGQTDVFVTGGTYSAGTITITNNTGGTFSVTGITTTNTNFANTDLTFTGNRTHNLDGNSLYMNTDISFLNLASFLFLNNNELQLGNLSLTEGMYLNFSGNTAFIRSYLTHDIINFNTGVGGVNSNFTVNDGSTDKVSFIVKSQNDSSLIVSDPINDKVGIGISTPTEKLTVDGNTNITGTLNIGTIGSGTPLFNLGIDSSGYVVTGSTNSNFNGGTVTGDTIFNQGLSASTISATTYLNLPITTDVFVTGGTYNNGDATFTNNTGGTFNVTGFYTGSTDIFVSGGTYSAGTITFTNTSGGTFNVTGLTTGSTSIVSGDYLPLSGGTVTGKTDFQSGVTINILTATTIVNTYLDSFYIRDNGGTLSIDNTTRKLLKSDGSTTSFDWENGILTGQTNIEASTISATTYQNLPDNVTGNYLPLSGGTVTGNTVFTQNISVTGGTETNWFSGSTNNDMLRVTQTGTGNAFVVEDSTNPDNTPFVITSGGSVGIGTTTPDAKLNVKVTDSNPSTVSFRVIGTGATEQFLVYRNGSTYIQSTTTGATTTIDNGTRLNTFVSSIGFQFLDSSGYGFHHTTTYGGLNVGNTNGNLNLWSQASDTLKLNLGGQDRNPTVARTRTIINPVGNSSIKFTPTGGTAVDYSFQNIGQTVFSPTGGTASYTQVELRPSYSGTGSYSGTVRGLYYNPNLLSMSGTTHRAIETTTGDVIFGSTSGNVGIGTSTPSEKLDVSGKTKTTNLQVTSGATAGYVLTALDNSGNTQWVDLGSNNELDPVITITGTPPTASTVGDRYLISGGTGIWTGRTNQIAEYTGVTPTDYSYYIPVIDDVVFVTDTLTTYYFNGTSWISWRGTAILQNGNSLSTAVNIGSNNNQNLTFRTSGQTRMLISGSSGNALIGSTTDTGERLQVNGNIRMSNPISTSALVFDTLAASSWRIRTTTPGGIGTVFTFGPTNRIFTEQEIVAQRGITVTNTLGTASTFNTILGNIFTQTTGSTDVTSLNITTSVIHSGTYSGVARGIYYNPSSVTYSGTHRAIETTRGDVIFGSTSGNVGIGTTSPTQKLQVSGNTLINGGLTANTISATTYQNLPLGIYGTGLTFNTGNYDLTLDGQNGTLDTISLSILASDLTVTGGTYDPNTGVATFTNNTGGTFTVTGFLTGFTDTFVTGGTYSAGTITFTNTSGGTFDVTGLTTGSTSTITGATSVGTGLTIFDSVVNGNIQINSITADTTEKITTTLNSNTIELGINEQNLTLWDLVVQGNRLLSGNVSYVSGLTFSVSPLEYLINGSIYEITSATTVTLNSGDTLYDRIDVIFADISGNTGVLEGTPSENPEKPIVDGDSQVEVTFVLVPANSTTPDINEFIIYNENAGPPSEWTFGVGGSQSTRISGNSTDDAYSGTTSIKVSGITAASYNTYFRLTGDTVLDTNNYATLQFAMKNLSANTTTSRIRLRFLTTGGTQNGNAVFMNAAGSAGYVQYSRLNVSTWQLISIPLWRFYLTNTNVQVLEVAFYPLGTPLGQNYYFDLFEFVEGSASSPPSNSWTTIKGDSTTTITAPNPNATLTISGGTNISSSISGTSTVVLNLDNNINLNGVTASTISATTYQNLPDNVTGRYLPLSGGTVTGNTVFTQNISVTGGTGINLFSGNTSTDLLRVTQTGSGNAFVVEDDTNPDSSPFVITSDGKVGIGLTTPTQRLLVRENTSGETRIDVSNQSTASGVSTSAYFLAGTTGNRYMSMGNYGPNATGTYIGLNKSGIGVFEAGVDTTAMIFNAANPSGAPIVFGQASTERMRISSTGNVGIGTTSPRQKLDVIGNTIISSGLTAQTAVFSSSSQSVLTVIGSGNSTTSPLFSVQGSSGELFSVSDSLVGSLFSVNDISGLPIMEVFSDNTTLWGSYQAPSLNTTVKTSAGTGSTTVYTIPQSAYTGAFFEYTVSSGSGARAGSIMSIFSGSSVQYTETTTNDIGSTTGLTFSVSANSTNAVLLASGVTAGWTIKTIVRSI